MPTKSKKSPKPSNPEQSKVTISKDGRLEGWDEFDVWARNNNALWAAVGYEARLLQLDSADRIKLLAYQFGTIVSKMIELDVAKARKKSGGSMIFPLTYEE